MAKTEPATTAGGLVIVPRRVVGRHPSGVTMLLASEGTLVTPQKWAEIEAAEIVTAPAAKEPVTAPADTATIPADPKPAKKAAKKKAAPRKKTKGK